jgi:hypothetical protein
MDGFVARCATVDLYSNMPLQYESLQTAYSYLLHVVCKNESTSLSDVFVSRTHPWTHYLPTGLDNLPAATAHTNTRL